MLGDVRAGQRLEITQGGEIETTPLASSSR
jgi:hypothetical protein